MNLSIVFVCPEERKTLLTFYFSLFLLDIIMNRTWEENFAKKKYLTKKQVLLRYSLSRFYVQLLLLSYNPRGNKLTKFLQLFTQKPLLTKHKLVSFLIKFYLQNKINKMLQITTYLLVLMKPS